MLVTDCDGFRFFRRTRDAFGSAYGYVVDTKGHVFVYATIDHRPIRDPGERSRNYSSVAGLLRDGFVEVGPNDFPDAVCGGRLPLPPLEHPT